eukprot:Phypoly_transcript_00594.p1 GENE.Phypoly_transcript_00594~~Phypoly_transcript_00594.p1  ORF type:complete len:1447 (+),score=245.47 Phypoly_transcript_00594:27-4367(+)
MSGPSPNTCSYIRACGHKYCTACPTPGTFPEEGLHSHEEELCPNCPECLLNRVANLEEPLLAVSSIDLGTVGNIGVPSATADLPTTVGSHEKCILTRSLVDIQVFGLPLNTKFVAQFSLHNCAGLSKPTQLETNKEGNVKYDLSYSNGTQHYNYFVNKGSERNSSVSGSATWKVLFKSVPPDGSKKIRFQIHDGTGEFYYEFLLDVGSRGKKAKNSSGTEVQVERLELPFAAATKYTQPNLDIPSTVISQNSPPREPLVPSHSTTTTATFTTTTTSYQDPAIQPSFPHHILSPPHQSNLSQFRGGSELTFASAPQNSNFASYQAYSHAPVNVPNFPIANQSPSPSTKQLAKVQIGSKLYLIPAATYSSLCAVVCQKLKLGPSSKLEFNYGGVTVEEETDLQMFWSQAAGQILVAEGAEVHTPRTVCPPRKVAKVQIGGKTYSCPASDFQTLYAAVGQKLPQHGTSAELRLVYGEENFSIDDDEDLQIFLESYAALPIHPYFAPPETTTIARDFPQSTAHVSPYPALPSAGLPLHSTGLSLSTGLPLPTHNPLPGSNYTFVPPGSIPVPSGSIPIHNSPQNTPYFYSPVPNPHMYNPPQNPTSPALSAPVSLTPSPALLPSSLAQAPPNSFLVSSHSAPNYVEGQGSTAYTFHPYSPSQTVTPSHLSTTSPPNPKKGKYKNLEEDLAQHLAKLAISDLVPLQIDLERFSEALMWKAVAPIGTVLRFGLYDKELAMSVPHLSIAQGSKISLKIRAELPCHVQILLDSEPFETTTMQKGSEISVKIGKGCPKEVKLVVKVIGEDNYGCSVPLTWIPVLPKKTALLVGFSYDEFPEGAKLYGTENDARRLASILKHLFGFGKLTLLIGADATYAKLSEILEELSGTLGESNAEKFVLYVSGHGVKWHGENGDEALLASDVRFKYDKWDWKGNSHLITDGFWAPFLEKVAEKVPVTMIFDTCHSGKAYRLPEGRAKTIAIEYFLFQDPPPNAGWYPVSKDSKFAFLAAAAHQEKALEIVREDGTSGSALIAAMEDVLLANCADIGALSYKAFHSYLVDRIKFYKTQQMPLLEGAIELGLFSSLAVKDPEFDSPITVQLVKKAEKEVTLSVLDPSRVIFNGTYHAIGKDNKLSALLQVDCASLRTAKASIVEDFSLEEGDTAIFVRMPKVDIVSESDEANALHASLQVTSSFARIVKKAEAENIQISLDAGNWVSTWCGASFLPPCPLGTETEFGERINAALRHISYLSLPFQIPSHRALKHIEVTLYKKTPNGPLEVAKEDPKYGFVSFTMHDTENGKYKPGTGDCFGFEVKNTSEDKRKEIYVAIFLFTADGCRIALYPKNNPRAEKLEYGQPIKCLTRPIPLIPSPSPPLPFLNTNHYWDVLMVYATSSFANYEHVVHSTSITRGNIQRENIASMHNFIHQSRDNSDLRFTVIQKPFILIPPLSTSSKC